MKRALRISQILNKYIKIPWGNINFSFDRAMMAMELFVVFHSHIATVRTGIIRLRNYTLGKYHLSLVDSGCEFVRLFCSYFRHAPTSSGPLNNQSDTLTTPPQNACSGLGVLSTLVS